MTNKELQYDIAIRMLKDFQRIGMPCPLALKAISEALSLKKRRKKLQ